MIKAVIDFLRKSVDHEKVLGRNHHEIEQVADWLEEYIQVINSLPLAKNRLRVYPGARVDTKHGRASVKAITFDGKAMIVFDNPARQQCWIPAAQITVLK